MLTLPAYANLQDALIGRVQGFCLAGVLPALPREGMKRLAAAVAERLRTPGCIAKRRLRELPIGVGDPVWEALMGKAVRRHLKLDDLDDRCVVRYGIASAVRLALLEGISYQGRLQDRQLSPTDCGWSIEEAVAFARRYCPPTSWGELAEIVIREEAGKGPSTRWKEVLQARARDEISFEDIVFFRDLRQAYDEFIMPPEVWPALDMPWVSLRHSSTALAA